MANVLGAEHITPVSRVRAAILGAALTVLALVGGLMGGLIGGSLIFHTLIDQAPDLLTYALAAIAFFGATLGGSALWGAGMARLARSSASRRAAWAGMLGFVPLTFLLNIGLVAVERSGLYGNTPVHRLFTMLFVPSAFLIAGASSLALAWVLGWGRAAPALAVRVGLTAALAFLAINLTMEALGWLIGAPGAEERGTMITVLTAGNLGAALAGGAMLGMTLNQRYWVHWRYDSTEESHEHTNGCYPNAGADAPAHTAQSHDRESGRQCAGVHHFAGADSTDADPAAGDHPGPDAARR